MSERAEAMERRFHRPVIVASLLVIPVMVLEGLDPGRPWSTIGLVGDCAIWLVFLAEVVAMLSVSTDRWRWVRSNPLDVMIVVLTPPLAPAVLQSVRILRLLRLVRLFRVARLVRGVFTIEGVRYAAFLAFLTLIVGAQVFASSETKDDSIGEGLYWAIGTMTTAGSGDINATTSETQAVGSVLMLVGLAFGAIITGAIAQRFIVTEHTVTQGNIETLAKQDATHAKLDAIARRLDRLELALSPAAAPGTDSDTAAERPTLPEATCELHVECRPVQGDSLLHAAVAVLACARPVRVVASRVDRARPSITTPTSCANCAASDGSSTSASSAFRMPARWPGSRSPTERAVPMTVTTSVRDQLAAVQAHEREFLSSGEGVSEPRAVAERAELRAER